MNFASEIWNKPTAAAPADDDDVITKSVRFNAGDTPYLQRTTGTSSDQTKCTHSFWMKRSTLGANQRIFEGGSNAGFLMNGYSSSDEFRVNNHGSLAENTTTQLLRDTSAFYHICVSIDSALSSADQLKLYINGTRVTSFSRTDSIETDQALNPSGTYATIGKAYGGGEHFDGYLADYYMLDGVAAAATDFAEEDATTGQWKPKAYSGSYGDNGFHLAFENSSNLGLDSRGSGGAAVTWDTSKYRASKPTPSWSQSDTQFDGVSGHVQHSISVFSGNGKYYAEFDIDHDSYITGAGVCPATWWTGSTLESYLHTESAGAIMEGDGGLQTPNGEISTSFDYTKRLAIEVDAQANTATFYEVQGDGSLDLLYAADSTDGLDFADNVAWGASVHDGNGSVRGYFASSEWNGTPSTGYVEMPSGNHFTATNLAASDVVEDTPTDNYAVLNPLVVTHSGAGNDTFSEGNTKVVTHSTGLPMVPSTIYMPPNSGTYYAEFTMSDAGAMFGIVRDDAPNDAQAYHSSYGWGYEGHPSNSSIHYKVTGASADTLTGSQASYPSKGGVSYNTATGEVKFYIGGSDRGGYTGLSTDHSYAFWVGDGSGASSYGITAHFDSDDWDNTPSGVKQLSTANLPTPTIAKPSDHFNTVLYTGNNSTNARTDVGFQPDLLWVKARNDTRSHNLVDSVRGFNGTSGRYLMSNDYEVESESAYINSLDSDGFTVSGSEAYINSSSNTYVAWSWKKSAAAGFNIVGWTGDDDSMSGTAQTITHGLNPLTPEMIIAKGRTDNNATGSNWLVYHKDLSSGEYLILNDNGSAVSPMSAVIDNIGATTVDFGSDNSSYYFNFGGDDMMPTDPDTYVAYFFASVEGYSKVGSYEGTGSGTDLPFIYTGFRPAFVMVKNADNGSVHWNIHDSARDPDNIVEHRVSPNMSMAEDTGWDEWDFFSNGFRPAVGDAGNNGSGATHIYYAVAEKPFKYASAR